MALGFAVGDLVAAARRGAALSMGRRRQQIPAGRGSAHGHPRCRQYAVRAGQVARFERVKAERDEATARRARGAARGREAARRTPRRSPVGMRARGARDAGRDQLGDGGRVRPLRHAADAGERHLWRRVRRRCPLGGGWRRRRRDRAPAAAASPGCSSPRWGRTGTIAAPIWSAPHVRRSRLRGRRRPAVPDAERGGGAARSTRMSTWSAPRASRRVRTRRCSSAADRQTLRRLPGRADSHGHRRRRDRARRITTVAARSRRAGDLRPRHQSDRQADDVMRLLGHNMHAGRGGGGMPPTLDEDRSDGGRRAMTQVLNALHGG